MLNFSSESAMMESPKNWCCQTGLNCRPLHYQWSALPLSYGSVPGSGESAQRALQGGAILATRPPFAQARGAPKTPAKISKSTGRARQPVRPAQFRADPVPICCPRMATALDRADHELEPDHF